MERKRVNKANFAEAIRCNDFLKTCIKQLEDGYCEYIGDESDQTVAEKLGVSSSTVGSVRKQTFGMLRKVHPDKRMDELIANLTELINRFNKLVIAISISKGSLDVRHLAMPPKNSGEKK